VLLPISSLLLMDQLPELVLPELRVPPEQARAELRAVPHATEARLELRAV
jgi:hypothetical protein